MKRIILAISILLVFGLAAAAIAYTTNTNVASTEVAASCCCKGDSCPMKKDANGEHASCCKDDCCKDGKCSMHHSKDGAMNHESCPMMKGKDEASHTSMTAEEHQAMMAEGKSCCCDCCKDKKTT